MIDSQVTITAFVGDGLIADGDVSDVARTVKRELDEGLEGLVRIFDDRTGRRLDLDFEGTSDEVAERARRLHDYLTDQGHAGGAAIRAKRGRGRPKLGVVAKEVTLLPRHWAWLDAQRGSTSATLRRLVDEARKASEGADRVRLAQDAAYRFMYDAAGDAPGFEEAMRSLYAGDAEGFRRATDAWPGDVRAYARRLSSEAFGSAEPDHLHER